MPLEAKRSGRWRAMAAVVWGLLALTSTVPTLAAPAPGAVVTFYLAPESEWNDGRPAPDALLPAGEVFLYRHGDYEPSLTGPLGEPLEVPPGRWSWIGEGPGFVTVAGGTLHVEPWSGDGEPPRKNILWPAVPACELVLEGSWRGVERVDVVSLSRHAVYPTVRPLAGMRRRVPAGEWIAYGVRGGALTGLSEVGRCRRDGVREITAPLLPPADRQGLVLHAVLPETAPELEAGDLEPAVTGGEAAATAPPTALFRAGRRATFFFRHLRATDGREILLRHPALRTVRQRLEPLGGSVRERTFEMAVRPTVELTVDYRPRREHRREELEVLSCGAEGRIPDDCTVVVTRTLLPGLSVYTVDDLDVGRYLVNARVDDEWVIGLGEGVEVTVTPETPTVLRPDPVRLEEMEIRGRLLEDGEPVPGEVVLRPRSAELPVRRAATGDDLLYHLHYFAHRVSDYDRSLLPEELASLDDDELRGLSYGTYTLHACGGDGHCRTFSLRTVLLGSGRLDLELGADRGLDLRVVDAETGEPVPRAPILLRAGDGRRLVFHDGDVHWLEPEGAETLPRSADDDGVARIRDLPPGEVGWMVKAPDYRSRTGRSVVPASGFSEVRVELSAIDSAGDVELAFPDGAPVAGGYALVFAPDGSRRPRCDAPVSASGRADFGRGCLQAARVVLLQPDARLTVLDGDDLATLGRATVEPAPRPAPRLRVVDPDGLPRAGRPVTVRIAGLTLGPTELLAPLRSFGAPLFYLTDGRGEIELRGVDPFAPVPPEVRVSTPDGPRPVSFAGWRPGESVEVVVGR